MKRVGFTVLSARLIVVGLLYASGLSGALAGDAPKAEKPVHANDKIDPALLAKVRPLYPDIRLRRNAGEPFFSTVKEVARVCLKDGTERLVIRAHITIPAARVDHGRSLLLFFKDTNDAEPLVTLSLMVPPTRLIEQRWLQFDPENSGTMISLIDEKSLLYLREHGCGLIIQGLSIGAVRDALEIYLEKGRDAFLERAPIRKHRERHVNLPARIRRYEIYPSLVEEMRYSEFKYADAWEGTVLVRLTPLDETQEPVILEIGAGASSAGITCEEVELLLWETRSEEPIDRPSLKRQP